MEINEHECTLSMQTQIETRADSHNNNNNKIQNKRKWNVLPILMISDIDSVVRNEV